MAKVFMSVICLAAGAWGSVFLFDPIHETRLKNIAFRVLTGDQFLGLEAVVPDLDRAASHGFCNPVTLRSSVIIRARLWEQAVADGEPHIADRRMSPLKAVIEDAIHCVPTEGFLWFMRYWTRVNDGADASKYLSDLMTSYRLAPFEGWIAVRRNVYALAVYNLLTESQQAAVRAEFTALVNSGLLSVAVRNLLGPGWPVHESLVAGLDKADPMMRYYFARMLRDEGAELAVPGVTLRKRI